LTPNKTPERIQRQGHLLLMLADGSTYDEMMEELGVSRCTITHDLYELRQMFGARNNPNLIALAYQRGFLNGRQMVTLDEPAEQPASV